MTDRECWAPGTVHGAPVRKYGEKRTLSLVIELRYAPEKVWQALTCPAHLHEAAPFDDCRSLGTAGTVNLTTVRAPATHGLLVRFAGVRSFYG